VVNADGTTAFNLGATVAADPTGNTSAGAGTIVGYVLDPALVRPVGLSASAALNAPGSPSTTRAFNTQLRVKNTISPRLTIVNNATYQYYKTDTSSNGGFYNWIEAKTFEHRLEALVRLDTSLFGLAIDHQSNTGVSYRYEPSRNYKDSQRAGYGPTGDQFDLTAAAEGYTRNAYFGATVFPFTGTVNDPVLTRFGYLKGFWAYYQVPESPANFVSPGGSATGTLVGTLAGQTYDTTTENLGFYTQHSVRLGQHLIWDFGLRQTLVKGKIFNPLPSPLVPGNDTIGNSVREWVPTWGTSLSYKPAPTLTTYATYQRIQAANGNTGGVVGWKTDGFGATAVPNRLLASDFHSLSVLHEIGAKAELIPGQLVASVAAYKQTRDLTLSLPAGFTEPVQAKGLYKGIEVGLRYQPTPRFSLGLNYTNLSAITLNSAYSNGAPIVADNATNIISSTTSVIRDYRITNLPRNNATLYTSYAFVSGWGVRADLSARDSYNVSNSGSISAPGDHRLNVGVFYNTQRYRVSLDVQNVTDRDSRAGGSTPLEPINAQSRITYRF
jgi:TonB dependent receptor